LWQSTGCWSIRLEISGTNCSSSSNFGPVTTQRVMGQTNGRTDEQTSEFMYKILTKRKLNKKIPKVYTSHGPHVNSHA
jgi:hypothetical protein